METLWRWSAVETAAAIRAKRVSCVEAVEAAVARMRATNPRVNAVTFDLADQALAEARRADAVVASGVALGPLHGVPVTIKENIDQKGLPNPNGVKAYEGVIAPDDSPVVAAMRGAGAIVIGRTNTPEFSLRFFTDNPLRGLTRNPWHDGITPGGSSGGAAAAVALGMGAIAHGNDLGGSLRYPAYCCGVATIRPSLGRVPAFNPSATGERPPTFQLMSVQGPIAREVRDVRLALEVMARPDPRDPWHTPAPPDGPRLAPPIRVALTTAPIGLAPHPAIKDALDAAARHLADAGYAVEPVDPPHVAEIAQLWRSLLLADARLLVEPAMREKGSRDINAVYDSYRACARELDLAGYVGGLARRAGLLRAWSEFMARYPLVLAPVSQVPPYPQGEDLKGPERMARLLDEQTMLYGVNLLGLPSAAVPTGLHDGVPVGVQVIGPRFREDLCLDAAEAIERAVGVLAKRLD